MPGLDSTYAELMRRNTPKQDKMRDLFAGRTGAEGDRPSTSSEFNPFGKSQGQLAQGSPIPSPYPTAAQVAMDPKPMLPTDPAPTPPRFDATRFDPVLSQTVSPPLSKIAGDIPTPIPRPAGVGMPATAPLPPTRAAAGLLGTNPVQTTAKPTGVPTTSPSTDLVQAPLPPERPVELGGDGPLARNPVSSGTAPTPMANPITPTSMLDNGNLFSGGEDFGQGLGPAEFDSGLGDLGDFSAGDQGGGADFAGDAGGGSDGGGGGGLGGLGALFGAIGKMAGGGGGGGGQGSAPKLPKPPPPPKLQPMEPDPGIAKRAQGAQQVISGILADPSLIDPRKRQGLLA
jgi:hypothetical protein